jgi:serine/threonine protein kinase
VLGSGGCATVYLATQIVVGRDVAVKIDNRTLTTERDQRRFYREVNAAGRLSDHPNVIGLYDAGTLADGRPYLVMELCTGGSLATVLKRRGGLPPDEVQAMSVGLADALGAAHSLGVLHRDLKPGNILVNRYGMVGLADFGLASIITADAEQSATLESLTPAYAPPEAFSLVEPAPSADVYSFGATLYALLSGRPPRFPDTGSPSLAAIVRMHDEPLPVLPWVPGALMSVIERAMAPNPADRFPDGAAMRAALARTPVTFSSTAWPGYAPEHATGDPASPTTSGASFRPPGGDRHSASVSAPPRSGPPQVGAAHGASFSVPPHSGPPYSIPHQSIPHRPPPHHTGPHQASAPERRGMSARKAAVLTAVGVLTLVAVVAAGLVAATRPWNEETGLPTVESANQAPTAATRSGPDYGVETTTGNCPATANGGRCVVEPECWSGMVVIVGQVTIERQPCEDLHRWETFAIAPLPRDALTSSQKTLAAHPAVKKLCSTDVMLASRRANAPTIPVAEWSVDVLPPSEAAFADGSRVYRCVAAVISPDTDGSTGSAFTG